MIYDWEMFCDGVMTEQNQGTEPETPVVARAVIEGKQVEFDFLGFEHEVGVNVMYLNLGPRR